jgi:sigma-B regulation protein RsbU (phosphoserine phosphatase)
MKLRTGLLLGIVFLVAALVGATVYAVVIFVDRAEREELETELGRGQRVVEEMLAARAAIVRSDCHVVANEPRLRAVVATPDVTRETIVDSITELRTSLGSDLFLLEDESGTLVGEAGRPTVDPGAAGVPPVLAAARTGGDGFGVWLLGDRPYQVHACRIAFGTHTVGIVVIGRLVDDKIARAVLRQTGNTTTIQLDGKSVAASGPESDFAGIAGTGRMAVEIDNARWEGAAGAFPGYVGKRALTYVVLRSLDEALAPARQLTTSVLAIAGAGLLFAIVLAFALARRLSRPVERLVELSHRLAQGDLDARARPSGAKEIKKLAVAMNAMTERLAQSRRQLAEKERLEREMEIAMNIQTSMLPRSFDVTGLDIAARMIPADEVGGDYYDIIPVADGCWIGIGDVAGHGLTAGLEMMMVQSVVAALVGKAPDAAPKDHVAILNRILYENIHERLQQGEHVTFTLLRYQHGTLTFAGAHEEILVCRAATGKCETHDTPGTWLAGMRDVTGVTHDTRIELAPGDLVVLYTDGMTEARAADGEQFGLERMAALVERHRRAGVEAIRDHLIAAAEAWQVRRDDDLSVVVLRVR